MATQSMKQMAEKMANLDICMFTTQSGRGIMNCRPMSNNGDVEYDGNSWFFTRESSGVAKDIEAHPQVGLSFEGSKGLYISINGTASLVHNKSMMQQHWVDSLSQWFKEGIETEGIVMVHVRAHHIRFWQNEEHGELKV